MKLKRNLCLLTMLFSMVMIFMLPGKAQAATVGQQLTTYEPGWQRIDDADSLITYNGTWINQNSTIFWNNGAYYCWGSNNSISFTFYGSKLRIIGACSANKCNDNIIIIDNNADTFNEINTSIGIPKALVFEKTGLTKGFHTVVIKSYPGASSSQCLQIDAFDIDDTGYLVPSAPINVKTFSENKKVTISWDPVKGATGYKIYRSTTPGDPKPQVVTGSAITITNYPDNEVDNGTAYYYTVSAIINGIEGPKSSPEAPGTPKAPSTISGNRAILVITFNNGKEKEYDLSADEIDKFTDWYDKRSDGSGKSYFALPKYGYVKPFNARKEFVKFDNIESFEIKDYNDK